MRWQIVVLGMVVVMSALAPDLAPYDPMQTEPAIQMQQPNAEHVLGTDLFGRDVLSRLLYGGQRTLFVAGLATYLAVTIGTAVGMAFAITNDWSSQILSAFTNAFLAFPNLLLAMVVLTMLGVGVLPLILATGVAQIAPFARVIRSTVIGVSMEMYVESGYAIGATRLHIVRFYILPNILPTALTYAAVTFAYCLLNSAALSFLGLGGEPGIPDWGIMLAEGRVAFRDAPWIALAPGLAITVTVWSINSLVGNLLATPRRPF